MMHIAIHDALNAIDRRSQPYAYDARARREHRRTRRSPRRRTTCSSRSLGQLVDAVPAGLHRRRASPASRPTTPPRSPGSATAGQGRGASRSARPRPPRSSRSGRTTTRDMLAVLDSGYAAGHRPRRVPLHARHAVRVRARVGARSTPFVLRDGSQFRPRPAASRDRQPRTPPTSTRSSGLGGNGVTTPSARTAGPDPDRAVLGRELTAAVEPDRQDGRRERPARPVGAAPACSGC